MISDKATLEDQTTFRIWGLELRMNLFPLADCKAICQYRPWYKEIDAMLYITHHPNWMYDVKQAKIEKLLKFGVLCSVAVGSLNLNCFQLIPIMEEEGDEP